MEGVTGEDRERGREAALHDAVNRAAMEIAMAHNPKSADVVYLILKPHMRAAAERAEAAEAGKREAEERALNLHGMLSDALAKLRDQEAEVAQLRSAGIEENHAIITMTGNPRPGYTLQQEIRAQLEEAQSEVAQLKTDNADARSYIERLRAEIERLRVALSRQEEEISQTLGKALGFAWFKDDQKNFPGSTEEHGVCVGDEVAETLALRAAHELERLRGERDEWARQAGEAAVQRQALEEAIRTECAKFNFPDEDRPELWAALQGTEPQPEPKA